MLLLCHLEISIHALREEGDQGIRGSCVNFIISIHALREEGDPGGGLFLLPFGKFLSTPSARRATNIVQGIESEIVISIHALREEGDPAFTRAAASEILFLSTPSARRATWSRPASR